MKPDSARFYFSFRSPYSWIGARLLQEHVDLSKYPVEYIPFWDPDERTLSMLRAKGADFHYIPMTRSKHLYILQDIKRLTSKLGYKLAWPVDRNPWWELPHLGYLVARKEGKELAYMNVVYRARWEHGVDICVPENLVALAAEAGVNTQAVLQAPDAPAFREEGALALYQAHRDGVFGIPFYIHGFEKFWGIDRFQDFLSSLTRRRSLEGSPLQSVAEIPSHMVEEAEPYDTGHPGGCG